MAQAASQPGRVEAKEWPFYRARTVRARQVSRPLGHFAAEVPSREQNAKPADRKELLDEVEYVWKHVCA
jgi:hypothetical protein